MSDLAVVPRGARPPEELPSLAEAVAHVQALAASGDAQTLDDAAKRAEAYALYEKRNNNRERESHFATLRVLAEAGIGLISFSEAYALLRKTLQALHDAQSEFSRWERDNAQWDTPDLAGVMSYLYLAEDGLGELLRVNELAC